jgi:hypothetical protein
MKRLPPSWAFEAATAGDFERVREAHRAGRAVFTWPAEAALRTWAKHQGWALSRWKFEVAFLGKMFESAANFALAVELSGISIRIPRRSHELSAADLARLDGLYQERAGAWRLLVESLREIRRAVEAGVVVTVDGGPALDSWQSFYTWAHGRYHALEDGADSWIGDDES